MVIRVGDEPEDYQFIYAALEGVTT